MGNDKYFSLDPLDNYGHLINEIKCAGPIIEIKVKKEQLDTNPSITKKMIIRCTFNRIIVDVTKIKDRFIDKYIQCIFYEIGIDCVEYDMWHYKRVRGPLTEEQKINFWRN